MAKHSKAHYVSSKLGTYMKRSKKSDEILTQTISQFPIPAKVRRLVSLPPIDYYTSEPLRAFQNNDFTVYAHSELGEFWNGRLIE
jgi:hypothetical protein